ncbi:hypothetical protein COW46_04295 [Candidatus Gracilibacteria bacterium CG17_big_fil_post_rev_8_21_14_2_50_48_13]|nr:MAG: hypothetical protein COW46_04295 [Candidatus Gracilibacteria bacterium CG17_big_fil_post_rev_8_21_14_2_50_48_13]
MFLAAQYGLAALLFGLGTWWTFGREKYLLLLLSICLVLGQLARLPLPISDIGILISDLLIPWIVFLWFGKQLLFYKCLPKTRFGLPIFLFLGIACFSLLVQVPFLPLGQIVQAGFYLVRLLSYFLLFFVCVHIFEQEGEKATPKHLHLLLWTALLLGITGILQFLFVPDFRFMAPLGWDPHIGRLLGTWYDPNYIAGFFSVVIGLFVCHWYAKPLKERGFFIPAVVLFLAVCFLLTYSRSGMVAFGVVVAVLGLLRFRSLFIVALLIFSLGLMVSDRLQERFMGLVEGGLATVTGSLDYDLDVTSQKRVESWDQSLSLLEGNLVLGIGYNTIEFRKQDRGLILDPKSHSASGSDSSLLNILLTTGILGLLLYCYLYASWCYASLRLFFSNNTRASTSFFGLGMFALLMSLLLHSFFVNSLLLPFFLMLLMPLTALLDIESRKLLEPLGDKVDEQA